MEQLIETLSPSTIAIELPPLLVPVVGAAEQSGDVVGGQMVETIAAAESSSVSTCQVSAPSVRSPPGFGCGTYAHDGPAGAEGDLAAHFERRHGRLAHAGVPWVSTVADLGFGHECPLTGDAAPAVHADHEVAHLRRSTTLLWTFEPPVATRVVDGVRERHMAERLDGFQANGQIIGVVGYGHLDGIDATAG